MKILFLDLVKSVLETVQDSYINGTVVIKHQAIPFFIAINNQNNK